MPSIIHESLVDLFRDSPALAPELISCAGTELPGRQRTPRLTAAEFADLKADEYRADAVIRLDAGDNTPSDIIIVEVQLKRDVDKRVSWPMYMAGARARYRCPATILVITIDPGVAQWCARPIVLDRNGSTIKPVVVGPQQMPRVTDPNRASKTPELAILSALAHRRHEDAADLAVAGLAACQALDSDRATRYADLILSSLDPAARRAMENLMSLHKYPFQSDFAKKYIALGRDEGRDEGRQAGQRAIVLRLLTKRFGPLPPAALERIEQADTSTLEDWADRLL
ncbi:MAG: DUF4351 domain-containing protein, partial [Proteobacteria bacterium]|nr:DUF4351 domain-containing protein [Pseudomonadota bacterium]